MRVKLWKDGPHCRPAWARVHDTLRVMEVLPGVCEPYAHPPQGAVSPGTYTGKGPLLPAVVFGIPGPEEHRRKPGGKGQESTTSSAHVPSILLPTGVG